MLLENNVVIVAGIGPGLGRAIALACAREGAAVAVAARTPKNVEALTKAVEELGGRALGVPTDVANDADCARLVERTLEAFGRIDGLVNNAFVMPPFEELPDQDVATIQATFDVNVFGPLRLSQAVIPHMVERGSGSIVMTNSVILRHTRPRYGAYKMAKHALLGLAQSLAEEIGPRGIRVNSVAPGYIGEGIIDLVAKMRAPQHGKSVEEMKESLLATLMLRRAAEPEEIADAIVFFLSDRSRAITGQCLDVNAGEHAN